MIPPVNSATLEKNPRFARVYQEMVKSRLNPDSSTKLIKQQRAALEVEKSIYEYRLELARRTLVEAALKDVIATSNLPGDLVQSCRVVLAMLNGEIAPDEAAVLKDDLERFNAHSRQISASISADLQQSAALIASMTPNMDPMASRDIAISQLPTQIASLLSSLSSQASAIAATRGRIADLTEQVGSTHRDVLEVAVRILEQTMHGSVSRGAKARSEHLAAVAKGLDMKIRIMAKSDPLLSDPQLVAALQKYDEHLASSIRTMSAKAKAAEGDAEEYASAGRGMEQIAEKYAELLEKRSELEAEISRLGG